MYGELHPRGGGDTIPLMKKFLVVGRRESCDIVLRWPNVSGSHCELSLVDGFWYVKDLASSNGTKVNGTRVAERRLDPGDTLSIARHEFEIVYEPVRLGATGAPVDDNAAASSRPQVSNGGVRGTIPVPRDERPEARS